MIRARLAERVSRGRAVTVPGRDRLEIVWIEQAPLRASAAGECTDMMARLEQRDFAGISLNGRISPRSFAGGPASLARCLAPRGMSRIRSGTRKTSFMKWRWKCGEKSRIRTAPIGGCCFGEKIPASPKIGRLPLTDRNRRLT